MTGFPEPRFVDARGARYAVHERGQGPAVILVHGWPEIAWSWKNQIDAIAAAGFRAVAIDLKGFGRSDAPADPALYSARQFAEDFAALLDALGEDRAVFVGHDWGGALVWSMAQWRPERVAGVIGVCTPLKARAPVEPMRIIEKRFGPTHYFVQFQPEGEVEALFETDIDLFFRIMFRKPLPKEFWPRLDHRIFDLPGRFRRGGPIDPAALVMPEADLAVYVDAYRRSGFRGGVNLYRNVDRNWRDMEGRDETVRAPALWIGAELDLFLPTAAAEGMEKIVPRLEKRLIAGCGHWAMWEKPAELNALLTDWLIARMR